jgi:diaminohydroxyphosphoribosylaminopyrimidine deaminase/5-amino-6-(5-phosphoribosylamino)uracil reductase
VIAAGFRKVVIGCTDPAPHVAGRGIARLKEAGIEVIEGLLNDQATRLIAPFAKLMSRQQPWVHAKWAMTLDGRIAAASGHSKWISNEVSRGHVHQLRGRMDAIVTGAGTVRSDDPLLTARPTGPRTALRVVLDSTGQSITADCQLVKSVREAPVLVCVAEGVDGNAIQRLQDLGCEVLTTPADPHGRPSLQAVLTELGKRQCTNVLLEAGSGILGSAFDSQLVDEVHVFVAPKIVGGQNAMSPVGGIGLKEIPSSATLSAVDYTPCGSDLYIRGDVIH